jgi:starch synthase (maltosyl-transferring)
LRERPDDLAELLLAEELHIAVVRCAERTNASRYPRELRVVVDRQAALYSAWYELMPRSQSGTTERSGTFDDVIARLPYVRDMGFDVLYFPPIHPIGRTNRKGRDNSLTPAPNDPGSPYAIGSEQGGHDAIHPELGTFEDFKRLVHAAHAHGLEIALDFAIQCSPDHPWIKQHPEWFDWRPDGTIKFAENPPKKYEDIVNVHLYRDAYPAAWHALRDVILHWIEQGVRIFRVDNPHTKPLPFWEWMIDEVRRQHPDVIFLAEAFTRPKMMKRLAKVGFAQSYTYFTWRTTKTELTEYLTELTQQEPKEYYRPNFFANTPDINPLHLQTGGRAAFIARATLAATLSSVYGIYSGFELCEASAIPGKEEYLNSEKYEIRVWDWDRPGNIRTHVTRLNRIRRDNPALHQLANLRFYNAFNDQILLYGKMTEGKDNALLIAVNLDPHHAQSCAFEVPLWEFGLPDHAAIDAEELLTGAKVRWHGKVQHMHLDPHANPCAIWRLSPMEAQT